ncbi:activating transcription factor 7-interacting protein 2 [Chaetodon trifascialis]|uniref:activating transcription factor 7-interacting protein 2 n=1 Tax=Chaetodon trifascialis TaxID=109706 RepID=UPI0039923411
MADAHQRHGCTAQKKAHPSTKPKTGKRLSQKLTHRSRGRARVDIGLAFERWRALKEENGLRSDAEVALCLLDVMKRPPSSSFSSGTNDKKIKFSQSEVQTLIEREVSKAVKKSETKLKGLIETIQHLDHGVDYDSSIQKLEARINTLTHRADAALAYMTKKEGPLASPANTDIIRPDCKAMETVSQNKKSTECMDKSGELFQMMESTKKALKKLSADNKALTAAIVDLSEELPLPHSPEWKGLVRVIKKEREELQEKENNAKESVQFEEPNAERVKAESLSPGYRNSPERTHSEEAIHTLKKEKHTEESMQLEEPNTERVKAECLSPGHRNSPEHTHSEEAIHALKKEEHTEESMQLEEPKTKKVTAVRLSPGHNGTKHEDSDEDKLLYPPLPPTAFPSVLNSEAASYNIPQRLKVHLALIRKPASLSVLWNVAEKDPAAPPMDSYSVYMTMEKVRGSGVFPNWYTLGDVKAIPLPICVTVSKYKPGHKVCVAVVGKDKFGRYGPYSKVVTAVIPD